MVRFPEIEVQLSGKDGNAFAIIGAVAKAMRRAGLSKEDVHEFQQTAMSGDYDNVLQNAMKTVTVN